jgi:hypothetical protein
MPTSIAPKRDHRGSVGAFKITKGPRSLAVVGQDARYFSPKGWTMVKVMEVTKLMDHDVVAPAGGQEE